MPIFSDGELFLMANFDGRLEAVNPNVAVAGEAPSCTVGWKTLKEEDDADHFTFHGDDRTLKIQDQGEERP